MHSWPDIERWRYTKRKELVAERRRIRPDYRRSAQATIYQRLRAEFGELEDAVVGFYWPIKGEINLSPMVRTLIDSGAEAALTVVVEKQHPLEFWAWHAATAMTRGIGKIPIPTTRTPLQPTALLVPLLGFDPTGHRLGYGGGYYDRTLANYRLKPLTIGVGFDSGRLSTIHPQPHDVPMDAIVTEKVCVRSDQHRTDSMSASPPCYLHEFEGDTEC